MLQAQVGADAVFHLAVERRRAQQHLANAQVDRLLPGGEEHLLLPIGAVEVAVAVARAGILQRRGPVEVLHAGRDDQRIVAVVHVRVLRVVDLVGHVDVNATQQVNGAHEGVEVHQDEVVDGDIEVVRHRLHGQRRAVEVVALL